MRIALFLQLALLGLSHDVYGDFVLNQIEMTNKEFEACQTCDKRSERAGNLVVSKALRDYLSEAPGRLARLAIDSGEVKVSERFPNSPIDTGHSCSKRAEGRNVLGTSNMIPQSLVLDKKQFAYNEVFKFAVAGGEVGTKVSIQADIRVRFGAKVLGKCHKIGRKTCGVIAESTGINEILVTLHASNIQTVGIEGQDFLVFNLGAKVFGKAKDGSFPPLQVQGRESCNIEILGLKIGSMNGLVRKYGNKFFKDNNQYKELATPKLIQKLEEVIGAHIGDEVRIPINIHGRRKRSVGNTKSCPVTCPEGWARGGNEPVCIKHFGPTKPNCKAHHTEAVLREDNSIPGIALYYCTIAL